MPPKPPLGSLLVRHRALPPIHSTASSNPNSSDSNKFTPSAKLLHSSQLFATHLSSAPFGTSNSIHNYLHPTPSATSSSSNSNSSSSPKTIRILPLPSDSSSSSTSHIASTPVSPKSLESSSSSSSLVAIKRDQNQNSRFTPLSASSKPPKMASPRNQKRDIHAPDFAYKVNFPVQPVPESTPISQDQLPLMPNPASDIAMKKYATSVDERNFLTVYEYMVNNQWVIWDYYTGYVHLTGLWKAIGNNKADIVKLVENSPDLEPVIRRVRGGFLKIQGTWLPFHIAKALAARTCYHIRYALIPIFGETFPDSCLQPHEPGFGQLQLHLTTTTKRRRKRATHSRASLSSASASASVSASNSMENMASAATASQLTQGAPPTEDGSVTGSTEQPLPRKRAKSDTHSSKPKPTNALKKQYKMHQQQLDSTSPLSAASAVASPPLSYMAPPPAPSAGSSSPWLFYASPQATPASAFPSSDPAHRDSLSSQSDAACSSDDDEPLLMTASAVSNMSIYAASAARSRRTSSSYHPYRSRRHSSRLFSASTTPTSSLPSSPTLMNQTNRLPYPYNNQQQHQPPQFLEPVTPPPMPVKLAFAGDSALAESPSEFVQLLQATRSLQQISMTAAAVAAADTPSAASSPLSTHLSFDSNNLGGGFEFAGKLWSWDGHEKLNIVGSAKDSPRVILPPPGSVPSRRSSTSGASSNVAPPTPPSMPLSSMSMMNRGHGNVMDISGLIS